MQTQADSPRGPEPVPRPQVHAPQELPNFRRDRFIALFTAVCIAVSLVARYGLKQTTLSDIPLWAALAVGGLPLLIDLLRKAFALDFGSDLLAGFSIVTAILLREYLVAAIVVLMLSGGAALEEYATGKASSLLRALANRMPSVAHRVSEGGLQQVSAEQVEPGDVLMILPHEICPADGEVLEGHGQMDESYLTGEPFLLPKAPGAQVISGAVNGPTALKIRALRASRESRYARIVGVVEEAERNRPPMRRIADRLGAWYTPLALSIALLGWWISGSPERFLAVVVIATPCPLLIAIPVAIIGGISLAAKRSIVIKNPAVLEEIDSCSTFIFDKTGTLTYGRPVLSQIHCPPGMREERVLQAAATLEQYSRHPLAEAVLNAARARSIAFTESDDVREDPGMGLTGDVAGTRVRITGRKQALQIDASLAGSLPAPTSGLECIVFLDERFAALFRFHDEARDESRPFVRHLSRRHAARRVVLLSGDRQAEVEHLAREVGIEEVYYGQTPEEKLAFVRATRRQEKTLFVGDGINDAPAMMAATVGVALGQNSDVTAEAAHAVVLDSSLRKVDELIHLARRVRGIALQSALGGMILSGIGMAAAACGWLPPLTGAIAQEVIDLAAVLNALRATSARGQLSDF